MTLRASTHTLVVIKATGLESEQAVEAIAMLIERGFDEVD